MPRLEDIERENRKSRRAHATKILVTQTDWLSGVLKWEADGVVFTQDGQRVELDAARIAQTQRRIFKIRQDSESARGVLSDVDSWIADRMTKLELAKTLKAIKSPDWEALKKNKVAAELIPVLVQLLVAEAVCVNALPLSPALLLIKLGAPAIPSLVTMVEASTLPAEARALAALVLGAIKAGLDSDAARKLSIKCTAAFVKNAISFGAECGAGAQPALCARLLLAPEGKQLAKRAQSALAKVRSFKIPLDLPNTLLASGVSAADVVAMLEQASTLDSFVAQMKTPHLKLSSKEQKRSEQITALSLSAREQLLTMTRVYIERYAVSCKHPDVPVLITEYALKAAAVSDEAARHYVESVHAFIEYAAAALDAGLQMPETKQIDFLRLLVESYDNFWTVDAARQGHFSFSLRRTQAFKVERLARLLKTLPKSELLYEAKKKRLFDGLLLAADLSAEQIENCFKYLYWFEIYSEHCAGCVIQLIHGARSATSREQLHEFMLFLKDIPMLEARGCVEVLAHFAQSPRSVPIALKAAWLSLPILKRTRQSFSTVNMNWVLWTNLEMAVAADAWDDNARQHCMWWLCNLQATNITGKRTHPHHAFATAGIIAAKLSDGEFALFNRIATVSLSKCVHFNDDMVAQGLPVLNGFPQIKANVVNAFIQAPQTCFPLFRALWLASRTGSYALDPLRELEQQPVNACSGECCVFIDKLDDDTKVLWARFLHYQNILGRDHAVPATLKKFLDEPQAIEQQLDFLKQKFGANVPPNLQERMQKLQQVLAVRSGPDNTDAICKEIRRLETQTCIDAVTQELYRVFLGKVGGLSDQEARTFHDNPVVDALMLRHRVYSNGDVLRRLLRAYTRGDTDWLQRQPGNAKFLKGLEKRGVPVKLWLERFEATIEVDGLKAGPLNIHIETDPLEVLNMGNYFGTCLSFEGVNEFSTIANACDLNKRVIYARDQNGRVVARKLIAINKKGELVGFRTYCVYERELGDAVRTAVIDYAKQFGFLCELELSNNDDVPKLICDDWYNDGAESWNDAERSDSDYRLSLPNILRPQPED